MPAKAETNTPHPPVRIILDTDMGNDIDDALAMAMLHAMQTRGECELLGITSSKDHVLSPVFIDVINTFYGRPHLPIGFVENGVTPEPKTFLCPIGEDPVRYPRTYSQDGYEPAVPLLRRLLAAEQDNSVTLVMIGFSTNIAQLFATHADEHSLLDGKTLFERKVQRVVAMAGDFSKAVQENPTLETREYNVHCDTAASMQFFNKCSVPLFLCGFEVGLKMCYPCRSILEDYTATPNHPVVDGYLVYKPMPYDRPMWDPATVMEAVRPGCGAFEYSPPGWAVVDARGIMLFKEDAQGLHRYLTIVPENRERSVKEIVDLCIDQVTAHCHPQGVKQ